MKKMTTLDEIKLNVEEINRLSKIQFILGYRNGFVYFEEAESHNTHLNSAQSKKELLIALRAFKEGLTWNQ